MGRLVWLIAGFVLGVSITQNAPAMPAPVATAVIGCAIVACGVCWLAGWRGKNSAVATAVAVARAEAQANAEAAAVAMAQGGAVNLHLGYGDPADLALLDHRLSTGRGLWETSKPAAAGDSWPGARTGFDALEGSHNAGPSCPLPITSENKDERRA